MILQLFLSLITNFGDRFWITPIFVNICWSQIWLRLETNLDHLKNLVTLATHLALSANWSQYSARLCRLTRLLAYWIWPTLFAGDPSSEVRPFSSRSWRVVRKNYSIVFDILTRYFEFSLCLFSISWPNVTILSRILTRKLPVLSHTWRVDSHTTKLGRRSVKSHRYIFLDIFICRRLFKSPRLFW
jgi:hypothetical protein